MGLMINTKDTQKIIAKLDNRFGAANFARLKTEYAANTYGRYKQFDKTNPRKLARIAYRIGAFPGTRRKGRSAKRWYAFLEWLRNNHSATHNKIRDFIDDAINNANCIAIKFVAVEGSTVDAWKNIVRVDDTAGTTKPERVCIITLQTMALRDDEPLIIPANDGANEDANERDEEDISLIEDPDED